MLCARAYTTYKTNYMLTHIWHEVFQEQRCSDETQGFQHAPCSLRDSNTHWFIVRVLLNLSHSMCTPLRWAPQSQQGKKETNNIYNSWITNITNPKFSNFSQRKKKETNGSSRGRVMNNFNNIVYYFCHTSKHHEHRHKRLNSIPVTLGEI